MWTSPSNLERCVAVDDRRATASDAQADGDVRTALFVAPTFCSGPVLAAIESRSVTRSFAVPSIFRAKPVIVRRRTATSATTTPPITHPTIHHVDSADIGNPPEHAKAHPAARDSNASHSGAS